MHRLKFSFSFYLSFSLLSFHRLTLNCVRMLFAHLVFPLFFFKVLSVYAALDCLPSNRNWNALEYSNRWLLRFNNAG